MIEVQNICEVNKGSLLATCDVYIEPWKTTLHEVKIFQKGANRWIGMPSREYSNDAGEKKYIELITFANDAVRNSFRRQIMGAIDEFLAKNPDMKPVDAIKEDQVFPF